ncbi:MAG: cyclase family protein [Clostridiales bacterium]|uniref:cyclase family protein n=1 Tax=Terrisporobacter sp. TaxID=1965305 RepID=UPI002A5590C5|nr:cyclase family protein [Terrisporobacter sp.]MCI7208154.1 cyclase family protein [Clostridium sp.]MDD7753956.1 cyclase family protein [Clostridiales bacterium]MDY4134058.1 cyclase family protein [Terrisporobacter sp.]MDY4735180.1 cyclase family protein [Terrisporobacter sp.]MDY6152249.1 cyclase family protein [Terrisporobacter sp.]
MKIIDLTHTIANDMTVYPGDDQPKNKIVCTVARDGYKETSLHIHSHNGTHMDSPNHVFENGITLDKIDVINFVGKAALIDCSSLMEGDFITYDFIENNKDIIDKSDFIIFRTDWSKYWNTDKYLGKYPILSDEVVNFIITSKKKGIGFDTISVDSIDSTNYSNHLKILGNDILIFENLTNLNQINSDTFVFCALPLKFENSDGAPIRAIAMLD